MIGKGGCSPIWCSKRVSDAFADESSGLSAGEPNCVASQEAMCGEIGSCRCAGFENRLGVAVATDELVELDSGLGRGGNR